MSSKPGCVVHYAPDFRGGKPFAQVFSVWNIPFGEATEVTALMDRPFIDNHAAGFKTKDVNKKDIATMADALDLAN